MSGMREEREGEGNILFFFEGGGTQIFIKRESLRESLPATLSLPQMMAVPVFRAGYYLPDMISLVCRAI